jgi:hypothetical protein
MTLRDIGRNENRAGPEPRPEGAKRPERAARAGPTHPAIFEGAAFRCRHHPLTQQFRFKAQWFV